MSLSKIHKTNIELYRDSAHYKTKRTNLMILHILEVHPEE